MKLSISFLSVILLGVVLASFNGCKSDDEDEPIDETPVISSFTPTMGIWSDEVTITGKNFNPSKDLNTVKFNGITADISSVSATELKVTVPGWATTGPITVEVLQKIGTSATDFTVPVPQIVDVTPSLGGEGLPVIIIGENFSATKPELNYVKFNETVAEVLNASANAIEVKVPAGATTGKVTVQIGGVNKATSPDDFVICNNAELVVESASAIWTGSGTHAVIVVKNVGKENIDLSQWYYQNYASLDNTVGSDAAAGGSIITGADLILETGEKFTINADAGLVNGASYNYFIINLLVDNGETVTECVTANNQIIVPLDK